MALAFFSSVGEGCFGGVVVKLELAEEPDMARIRESLVRRVGSASGNSIWETERVRAKVTSTAARSEGDKVALLVGMNEARSYEWGGQSQAASASSLRIPSSAPAPQLECASCRQSFRQCSLALCPFSFQSLSILDEQRTRRHDLQTAKIARTTLRWLFCSSIVYSHSSRVKRD